MQNVANGYIRQTADTFQAAATFLELCQIWGLLDSGLAAKIKFAKYHALRIAKAVKAGEDPNESNPSMEGQEAEKDGPSGEQDGPTIAVTEHTDQEAAEKMRQATVEDAVDDADSMQRKLAQQSSLDESLHPSRMASPVPARPGVQKTASTTSAASASSSGMPSPNIFPASMLDMDNRMRQRPSALASYITPDLPAAPSDFASPASSVAGTPSLGAPPEAFPPVSTFQSFPPPDPAALPPQATLEPVGSPLESPAPSEHNSRPLPPQDYGRSTHLPPTSVKPSSAPRSAPRSISQTTSSIPAATRGAAPDVDEDSIAQAQKHARWAVSALTFDDVNTAVKELRNALASLGQR